MIQHICEYACFSNARGGGEDASTASARHANERWHKKRGANQTPRTVRMQKAHMLNPYTRFLLHE